jgi:hypothetical protein
MPEFEPLEEEDAEEDETPVGWSPLNEQMQGLYLRLADSVYYLKQITEFLDTIKFVIKLLCYAALGWCLGYVIGTVVL